jgi:hypothetical protein
MTGLDTYRKLGTKLLLSIRARAEHSIKNWQRRLEEVDFDDPHSIYRSRKEYERRIRHLQADVDNIDTVLAERNNGGKR